ncbi:uncharacterized protein LOC127009522 [Eriocheir sinensis]|uniref:uncharacterized protein LOC127009522 n=1 Tax=Eriocheir sinensis TaxID=95602 RepID=UPI0021C94358|nr:uncharacterized protein LOC127009522 [Eriocheir sinensis]
MARRCWQRYSCSGSSGGSCDNDTHKPTRLSSPRAKQGQDASSVRGTSLDRPKSLMYISNSSLYEPFDDTGLRRQQGQGDRLLSGSPPPGTDGAVYVITNSLYEPFCALTDKDTKY